MKRLSIAVGLFLSALASQSLACGLKKGYVPFEYAPGAVAQEAAPDTLDAPDPTLVEVVRGVGGAPGTCDGTGMAVVRLKWSDGDYRLSDVGFEFRVVWGQAAQSMFPKGPIALAPDIKRDELVFMWNDDAPGQQQPLQMQVEVRAVTRDRLYGPAATFFIDTRAPDVVKQEREAREEAERAQRKLEKELEKERKRAERAASID